MSLGVGDIVAISGLALKVCTAYKDALGDYQNISDEVESLHIIINRAAHHFESTTLSDNSQQEGHKVLRGCHKVLVDLDALIEKYNSLASKSTGTSTSQALQRLKLSASLVIGTEDIATLRARLTSNTTLLNGFIQRFGILPLLYICFMLISLYSCDSHKLDAMQAQLNSVLGLRRTTSRDSIISFAGSVNTKKAYKKFCKGLFNLGVTAEMISQKEKEIQDIFKTQHPAASSQTGDSTSADPNPDPNPALHPQLPEVGNSSDAENSPISSISIKNEANSRSRFGWVRPPIDFLVGPLMLAAAEEGDATRLISTLGYIRNINFKGGDQKETALHKAAARGHMDIVQLLLSKGASIEAKDTDWRTPLHCAALGGHTSTVGLLLSKGASLEVMDTHGWTPSYRAAWYGHTSTVELLLSKGASFEAKDPYGWTLLHRAAWGGHTSTVELLLRKEADSIAWCSMGRSYEYSGATSLQRSVT